MSHRIYYFETLEIYRIANQLARLIGAIGASLDDRHERKLRGLIAGCMNMTMAIAAANAEVGAEDPMSLEERMCFSHLAFDGADQLRRGLRRLQKNRLGSQSHVTAALELLERMDAGLAENAALLKSGFVPGQSYH